jgi:DNA-directed RNA polymerase specialized sigma24 family protein
MSDDADAILSQLRSIGTKIRRHTQARDSLAAERRALYVQGETAGLTHRKMAEVQGITEGAVHLALRKVEGRESRRPEVAAKD